MSRPGFGAAHMAAMRSYPNLAVLTAMVHDDTSGEVDVGGDIIVGVDGKQVKTSEELAADIGAKKPGDTVSIELLRANGSGGYAKKTITATLGQRPNSVPNPNTPE